jgi:hypothetical protein
MKKNNLMTTIFIYCLAGFSVAIMSVGPVVAADDLPGIVSAGLKEYKDKGPEAAIKAWIKGSAVETSIEAQSQANLFRQVESLYGKYIGNELVMIKEINKTSSMVYITLNYEKGPLFANFLVYKNGGNTILAMFNFNTKPDAILPHCYGSK